MAIGNSRCALDAASAIRQYSVVRGATNGNAQYFVHAAGLYCLHLLATRIASGAWQYCSLSIDTTVLATRAFIERKCNRSGQCEGAREQIEVKIYIKICINFGEKGTYFLTELPRGRLPTGRKPTQSGLERATKR